VWRLPGEAYNKYCIRRRWKGFSEFIFWGSFSFNKKGLYYVWEKETPQEKRDCKADLDGRNSLIEKANKEKWEKEQRKWLRDWKKAYSRAPRGVRKV
jgi:hypothetical protein